MKKLTFAFALFAFAAPLFAQSGGCTGLVFGSEQKARGKFDTTFSATQIIDLDLSVTFPPGVANKFTGDHVAEVRIMTPRGHLYQSMSVPFTSDASRKGAAVSVNGYPDKLPLRVLDEVTAGNGKQLRVFVTLPVAGTPIMTNSMYGTWTAQAFIDGEPLACSKPAPFTITM
jgi:hypothetical protein